MKKSNLYLGAVFTTINLCSPAMALDFSILENIMDSAKPALIKSHSKNVSAELCGKVSADGLDKIVAEAGPSYEVEVSDFPNGHHDIPAGTRRWSIKRNIENFLTQTLAIDLEGNADHCIAYVYNRSAFN